jgi:hypothetical protein
MSLVTTQGAIHPFQAGSSIRRATAGQGTREQHTPAANDWLLLGGFVAAVFVGLLVGYPVLLDCLGEPSAVPFLSNLTVPAAAVAGLTLFGALARRAVRQG